MTHLQKTTRLRRFAPALALGAALIGTSCNSSDKPWLAGKVKPEEAAYYANVMKKVVATPEWKEYVQRTQQTAEFVSGQELQNLIKKDLERTRKIGAEQGWLTGR